MNAKKETAKTLTSFANNVDEFQKKIQDLPIPALPAPLSKDRMQFRVKHMEEELEEFMEAYQRDDLNNQIDSLIDLVYVAIGAILEMGVPPNEPFQQVHEANMRKIRGETKREKSGGYDATKPDGWTPPDIDAVLADLQVRYAVSHVLIEITRLRVQKGKEYNSGTVKLADHFPLGDESYFQMVWVKVARLRSMLEARRVGTDIAPGRLREELVDLLNYATYWTEAVDRK